MTNPMTCSEATPLLDEYATRELEDYEDADVEEHLRHCADCRSTLRDLRLIDARIRSLPAPSVPASFVVQVQMKIPAERLGLNQRATAPSGWLSEPVPTSDEDRRFLRFTRDAA